MKGKQFDIVASLAQRWLDDTQHAKPVIKILSEAPFSYRRFQVDVRRGNDADVDINGFLPAQAFNLTLLQKPQKASLAVDRQVTNLVQKQRAAASRFDTPYPALRRTGKGAAFVAKKLRLNKIAGDSSAVNCDKWKIMPRRAAMNSSSCQFFPRPRLPCDENGGIR